jgi:hypothetical protein
VCLATVDLSMCTCHCGTAPPSHHSSTILTVSRSSVSHTSTCMSSTCTCLPNDQHEYIAEIHVNNSIVVWRPKSPCDSLLFVRNSLGVPTCRITNAPESWEFSMRQVASHTHAWCMEQHCGSGWTLEPEWSLKILGIREFYMISCLGYF